MPSLSPTRLKTISDLHRYNNIAPPEHPLISLIDYSQINPAPENNVLKWVQQFYSISIKRDVVGKYRYGQQSYDFDEGLMTFFSPEQLVSVQLTEDDATSNPSGWILAIHPDFLFGTSLATSIKKYSFLKYSVREALFLSEKEETVINEILQNIQTEYQSNIDQFSQQIIINQLELLLSYAERFYQRQFLTRKVSNHQILDQLEQLLEDYFSQDDAIVNGLPSVQEMAQNLNLTPDYLSSMLKSLTGQTTQQHIHQKLIEKAKVQLSTTNLSVGEIAYGLGFEHPQSFSKLFKSKTRQTPIEFRTSFN
ncbi:helix-turn-helix domain-containing protein [Neolewinella agarilytica]|uniref:Transcriptional regulator, AraC family n=1 Tax=Neolewinella agarilytica TaxID=478744 RepID=A0A1H9G1Y0_9BACT|nr:response regulator transcription factor [Neolewinella agarilytica]SEQ44172.1 transcriptional regulator, AraC family [Neolewinella agarilytica]